MAIVFKTPKSALNTTSGAIQIKNGDNLQEKSVTYNQEGEFTVVPDPGMYGLSKVDITIDVPSDVHNQTATVDPSTSQQVVEPEEGYTGLSSVTVNAVTSAIDQNIAAGNIKNGVTILGVQGSFDGGTLQNKTVSPSTSSQSVTADSPNYGLGTVTVNAVTAAIDSNIQAANIKNGVSILGVAGNVVEANLSVGKLVPDKIGATEFTPTSPYNGFSLAKVIVSPRPLGTIGTPFSTVRDLESDFESGYLAMEVTGSEFNEGERGEANYYTVEDEFGNVITNLDAGIFNQFTDNPFDFTGKVITVSINKADVTINEDDSDPQDIKYTYEISDAALVGIDNNFNEASWFDDRGEWLIGRNEYDGGWILVEEVLGSYGNAFDNNFDLDETFLKVNADTDIYWYLEDIQSGSIDPRSGCYVAEDALGVTAYIQPYLPNPDFDSEQEVDPIDNPEFIFPENFDLTGLNVEVAFTKDNSAVTDNPDYDPDAAEPTPETERKYDVEIGDCRIVTINYNGDMDTWEQCYFPPAV